MYIDDIEGVRPRDRAHTKWATKESMKLDDIEGTKAKPRHKERQNSQGYSGFDYTDVTKTQFVSKRSCNPLNPTYEVRDENGKLMTIGEVDGSKPTGLPPQKKNGASMAM